MRVRVECSRSRGSPQLPSVRLSTFLRSATNNSNNARKFRILDVERSQEDEGATKSAGGNIFQGIIGLSSDSVEFAFLNLCGWL